MNFEDATQLVKERFPRGFWLVVPIYFVWFIVFVKEKNLCRFVNVRIDGVIWQKEVYGNSGGKE